jgi:hypothetical protein
VAGVLAGVLAGVVVATVDAIAVAREFGQAGQDARRGARLAYVRLRRVVGAVGDES